MLSREKLEFEPAVADNNGEVAGAVEGVGEEEKGGQGRHPQALHHIWLHSLQQGQIHQDLESMSILQGVSFDWSSPKKF